MGTIIKRERNNGSTVWVAQISIMRQRKIVWRESNILELRSKAAAWIEKREKELARPDALEELQAGKADERNPALADARRH